MSIVTKNLKFPRNIPGGGVLGKKNLDECLWLKLEAFTLKEGSLTNQNNRQSSNARNPIDVTPQGTTIELLLPESFQLGMSHEWTAYDSLNSKLAEKAAALYKAGSSIGNTASIIKNIGDYFTGGGQDQSLLGKLTSGGIVNTRVDSPLVYKSSSPIEYNVAFSFVVYDQDDVIKLQDIVQELLMLSSPKKSESLSDVPIFIKPPNVFKVMSYVPAVTESWLSTPIIYVKLAALTSIQPNWKAPYYKGRAMALELTLTFKDITPVFNESFAQGSGTGVTVGSVNKPSTSGGPVGTPDIMMNGQYTG